MRSSDRQAEETNLFRLLAALLFVLALSLGAPTAARQSSGAPEPLFAQNDADDWIFAFKLNATTFPTPPVSNCVFGGSPQTKLASQQFIVARSSSTDLTAGAGLLGSSVADSLGATFSQVYNSNLNFVVWNDQLYQHPRMQGCGDGCSGPWGHSKGLIAWNETGDGLVLQVTTPSWPASGTAATPRTGSGNTLGCIAKPNNILYSQHFFALRLTPSDTAAVLEALTNASVVTDVTNPQLARLGGPNELRLTAMRLGRRSNSTTVFDTTLSSGIRLISKPSELHVPPWQMVSARLGGVSLRTATWWAAPRIPTTERGREIICWRNDLGAPGRVEVALTGRWADKTISLKGGGNHAKLGVSLDGAHPYVIFGDLNQQGRLTNKCDSSQNGRGGLFFVLEDQQLHDAMADLLAGDTAPLTIPGATNPSPRSGNNR